MELIGNKIRYFSISDVILLKKGGAAKTKTLASVLKQALAKTKINKPVSLHWLRHSYATHLLKNRTDLRYGQEKLGQSSSMSSEIYTHVNTNAFKILYSHLINYKKGVYLNQLKYTPFYGGYTANRSLYIRKFMAGIN